jgi:dihydropteroate synthase
MSAAEHNRDVIAEIGGHRFEWGSRTYVMGIVNVTPDSFSGDGLGADVEAAIEQGQRMVREGADMLDVGGESTRPGHVPVTAGEEIQRVDPVVRRLAADAGVPVSIDTYKEKVAARAIAGGATILNDVWGLTRSPALAGLAARHDCALVLMHNQDGTDYAGDLMDEIKRFLALAANRATAAGVPREKVILDPGIGFGKTTQQNVEALLRIPDLKDYGFPILVGASRKRFLGSLTGDGVEGTLIGTVAVNLIAAAAGASIFRVHDVAEHVAALRVWHAIHANSDD